MREKGFVAPIAILAVVLGGVLLSAGIVQSKKDLAQKFKLAISSNVGANNSSSSNKFTEAEIKAVKEEQKANTDMIIIYDEIFVLGGNHKYKLYLPRKGGDVTGTISGVCNGHVTGTYDGKNLGKVYGNIVANCPAGPGNLFRPQVKIEYEGVVNLTEGKVNGPWKMTEPITMQNDYQIAFTPTSADQNSDEKNKDKLVDSGFFQFSENKVPYEFSVPKSGGSVTGYIGGVCSGAPDGNFDGKEGGKVEGTLKAKCTTGPLNLINVDIQIKYTGTVSIKEKKAFLNYEVEKPVSGQRGYVPINFNN